jgi:hypothetical protein
MLRHLFTGHAAAMPDEEDSVMSLERERRSPEKLAERRTRMVEHLESALAIADETGAFSIGYMIALDQARPDHWQTLDSRLPNV